MSSLFIVAGLALAGCIGSPPGSSTTTSIASPPAFTSTTSQTVTSSTSGGGSAANGQRIYFYATSQRGDSITYTGGPGMMMQGVFACVTCHGSQGHGGQVNFMMQSFDVPDITWPALTGPDPDMEHPPYTEETLKRAITLGLDPGGGQLEYPMPRWQMSAADLDDLVAFIETLK